MTAALPLLAPQQQPGNPLSQAGYAPSSSMHVGNAPLTQAYSSPALVAKTQQLPGAQQAGIPQLQPALNGLNGGLKPEPELRPQPAAVGETTAMQGAVDSSGCSPLQEGVSV